MAKSRIAVLMMLWVHYNHDDRDITMSIALKKAWIVDVKRLPTSITKGYVRCCFLHKRRVKQKMAALPHEVQFQCFPFSNIGMNLCAALVVHAMTNKRATLKVWNVIFVCLNNKVDTIFLAHCYGTEDFFLAYKSCISDHGLPTNVYSDKGSQLVAANREIANYEWEVIAKKTSAQGTSWKFAPAGGQW